MRVLIAGARGQLAMEFQRRLEGDASYQVTALGREELDVSDAAAVDGAVSLHRPAVVLNCAAYNLVDRAEEDDGPAFRINAKGVRNLAASCRRSGALLVHYSTDYVFDGTKEGFYTEEDPPCPLNKYGESKRAGETLLREETEDFLLFRVSWVFGQGTQNFLYKLSEWAKRNAVLKVVGDQVSVPTYTEDIVDATLSALKRGVRGMYHLTNSGYASRYEVARYYLEKAGLSTLLLPVTSDHFPTPAKRPYFTAMSNAGISRILGRDLPDWRDAVDRFIKRMETK
ncbi:MAG: dTDP-4-dehydrorhamnose reductase [Thermodesulfovibrionales bacterium]